MDCIVRPWGHKESDTTEVTRQQAGASLVAQRLKHLPGMQETRV